MRDERKRVEKRVEKEGGKNKGIERWKEAEERKPQQFLLSKH